jgi:hypothetical protein
MDRDFLMQTRLGFGIGLNRRNRHAVLTGIVDSAPEPPSQNVKRPPDLYSDRYSRGVEIRFVDWQPDGELFIFQDRGVRFVSCPKFDRYGYLHPLYLMEPGPGRRSIRTRPPGYTRMTLGAIEAARDRRRYRKARR